MASDKIQQIAHTRHVDGFDLGAAKKCHRLGRAPSHVMHPKLVSTALSSLSDQIHVYSILSVRHQLCGSQDVLMPG